MLRTLFTLISCVFVNSYTLPPTKFVREAEIKHGRVAMLSSVLIPLLDNLKDDTLGVNFVNSLDTSVQLGLLGLVGVSEFAQLLKAYNFPRDPRLFYTLKQDHTPGDYNFDPLNLSNSTPVNPSVELNVGRLAMLGVTCEMVNELATGTPVF